MKRLNNALLVGIGIVVFILAIIYAIVAPRSAVQAPSTATQNQLQPGSEDQSSSTQTQMDDSVNIKMTPAPSLSPTP